MRCEILYQAAPAWRVGETSEERDERLRPTALTAEVAEHAEIGGPGGTADVPGREEGLASSVPSVVNEQYPDCYAGRVISVVPEGHPWGPGDLADPNRRDVTLDLSESEIAGLTSRQRKILTTKAPRTAEETGTADVPCREGGPAALGALVVEVVPVTFDDRWGAVAAKLRERHPDPEAWEREDLAARETVERANAEAEAAFARAIDAWQALKSAFPRELHEWSLDPVGEPPAFPERPAPPRLAEVPESSFDRAAADLARSLPQTVVHTGAGLYEVGPTKTYSTIQSALDQLWADQGSAAFTATQYVRVFAGTYNENVTPNAGIRPAPNYAFVIEGDPDDSRANVHLAASAGLYTYTWTPAQAQGNHVIRHLTFDGTPSTAHVKAGTSLRIVVRDCAFNVAVRGVYGYYLVEVEDSAFVASSGDSVFIHAQYGTATARRCSFKAQDTAHWLGVACGNNGASVVEGCTFSTMKAGVSQVDGGRIAQNAFYNCATGVLTGVGLRTTLVDNIFSGCTTNINVSWGWPQITATAVGPPVTLRNNCFHGYTDFAYDGATAKTFAEFTAMNLCDAAGDLDATDPLLTAPATDDFSLQAASPCLNAGAGSGVVRGINDVEFDPHHPDIGAWSSGDVTAPAPARPSVAVTGVAGAEVTVETAGAPSAEHTAELVNLRTGEVVDGASRSGPGEVVLTAPELSARYAVVATCANVAGRSPPSAPAEVFVPEGEGPFEELRSAIVSRLAAHAGLAALLGTDDSGAVPIYAAHPATARRVPSVAYTLGGVPDARLDRPGRWLVRLDLESWGGTSGVNDMIVSAADEVLQCRPFEGTAWAVKRIARTGDATRREDDGRAEVRVTTWSVTVDRIGS